MLSFFWKVPKSNNTQLEQKVQQLEQQIQQLTTQLQNVAKINQTNSFRANQKIVVPNKGLAFVQDNNPIFLTFEKANGDQRGLIGIDTPNTQTVKLHGAGGVEITSQTGDLMLNPGRFIDANHKKIINLPDNATDFTSAVNMNQVSSRFIAQTQKFVNPTPGTTINWGWPSKIANIISMEQYKEISNNNWEITSAVRDYWISPDGTLNIKWNQKPAPLGTIIIKLFFIRKD